jgi:hypothetical protein
MPPPPPAFCNIYAQFDQVDDLLPDDWDHLANLGLVADVTVSLAQAERHRAVLARVRAAGGLVTLNWYPRDADPACADPNWWRYDAAECLRLVRIAQARFAALGLGDLEALNTYTTGNSLVHALRAAGIRHLTGFCAPTVIEDGGWSIAHYGSPLSPYFVSDEDFRKPEHPRDRADALLIASMELRNPLVCARHWSEGPWCPLNAQAADRWLEPTDTPWPFLRVAEDWIRQGEADGVQRFFHLNLQYFFAGACRGHNRRALEWLALQRDRGRHEVGSQRAWAARLRAQGGFVPQATWWRGEMAGFHVGNRPGFFADTVVDESLARQAVFVAGRAEPQRLYDYRPAWSCHPFRPAGGDPPSADATGLTLTTRHSDTAQGRAITVTVTNHGAPRLLPLAAWDALADAAGPFSIVSGPESTIAARVLPHPAGRGGLLVLETTWPAGTTAVTVTVAHHGAGPIRHRRAWGDLIEAQTFVIDHRPCTVLAIQAPARVLLGLRAADPARAGARVEGLVGLDQTAGALSGTAQPLVFDGTRLACWHRVWDRHADEIELDGVAEAEAALRAAARALADRHLGPGAAIPAPGYQRHGDLLDAARWDLPLGRAAGAAEIRAVETRLRELRPGLGRIVAAVHPGAHLPCGSITKVLGHRFDVEHAEGGFHVHELCADYPQAWAPGVAAWVQWRWLKLALSGPWERARRYRLHLHACDPEFRDLVQRVHLFDAGQPSERQPHVCVEPAWPLPAGIAARHGAEAFRSLDIPAACLEWKRIGIWINPVERSILHHWVDERGAAGLFMHLWLEEV